MAAQSFTCPNCGAALDSPGDDTTTLKCPYCNTSVIVPEELRTARTPTFSVTSPHPGSSKIGAVVGVLIVGVILLVVGVAVLPIILVRQVANTALQALTALPAGMANPTRTPQSSATPQPVATPAYAQPGLSFGQAGIGAGMLNDARYIAIDGNQTIYVADYQGGRIQAFDLTGKYLHQFKVGHPKTIIAGLAANHTGDVFVAYDTSIFRYKGATGELLGELTSPVEGTFGELSAAPDGSLAATWYEGRWGLITTLEGHRDDLVIFNPQGKISLTISSFISGQTGDLALDNFITVDGLGNIFALSANLIYQFSAKGKYLNHFGSHGDNPGQFGSANCIAVDGQGQLTIGDSDVVHVFSPDGQFVADFPTGSSVSALAFDEKGTLWVLSRDKVTQFVKQK